MISRRRFASILSRGVSASLGLSAIGAGSAAAWSVSGCNGTPQRRRLLVFTKSAGYEHDVVRATGGEASVVERAIGRLAERIGYDVVVTKDGARFADELPAQDAVLFYTTGDLTTRGTDGTTPLPTGAKEALLRAIDNGLGFIGVHSASDTFHSGSDGVDPYIAMLGGEFEGHGRPQRARVTVVDRSFPGFDASSLDRHGEWYAFRNLASDLNPLLVLETATLEGREYARPGYPVAWTRRSGQGRVFYTALGHFAEEWQDPDFLRMLEGGIRWAAGEVAAEAPSRTG